MAAMAAIEVNGPLRDRGSGLPLERQAILETKVANLHQICHEHLETSDT